MTTVAAPRYIDALRAQGEPLDVGGNKPFALDGAGTVWLVESGRVEVFVVNIDGGQPTGARRHFFTAEPGDVMFGVDRPAAGLGLLAVGAVGTRLVRLPIDVVQRFAQDPDHAEG